MIFLSYKCNYCAIIQSFSSFLQNHSNYLNCIHEMTSEKSSLSWAHYKKPDRPTKGECDYQYSPQRPHLHPCNLSEEGREVRGNFLYVCHSLSFNWLERLCPLWSCLHFLLSAFCCLFISLGMRSTSAALTVRAS